MLKKRFRPSPCVKRYDGTCIFLNRIESGVGSHTCCYRTCDFEDLFTNEFECPAAILLSSFGIELDWIQSFLPPNVPLTLVDHSSSSQGSYNLDGVTYVFPPVLNYGTMHAKVVIVKFESFLRIAITTGNLCRGDWKRIGQTLFIFDAEESVENHSSFQQELSFFVSKLLRNSKEIETLWLNILSKFSISPPENISLVSSIPGMWSGDHLHSFGHMRMRKLIKEDISSIQTSVCYKASSVGSAASSWMKEFTSSLGLEDFHDLRFQWPEYEWAANKFGREVLRCSEEHWNKKNSLHKEFFSELKQVPERSQFVCHAKIAYGNNWLYMGSHNLSQPAWGNLINEKSTLRICSFEIGILFKENDNEKFNKLISSLPFVGETSRWPKSKLPWTPDRFQKLVFSCEGNDCLGEILKRTRVGSMLKIAVLNEENKTYENELVANEYLFNSLLKDSSNSHKFFRNTSIHFYNNHIEHMVSFFRISKFPALVHLKCGNDLSDLTWSLYEGPTEILSL